MQAWRIRENPAIAQEPIGASRTEDLTSDNDDRNSAGVGVSNARAAELLVTGGALRSSALCELVPESESNRAAARVGLRVGEYELAKLLGVGGMGAVYLAVRETKGFHQEVALKLLGQAAADDNSRMRFELERNILAQLNHPNIAHLLDGGETDEGLLYFTIELVDGIPINEYCKHAALTVNARLRLLLQVASAISYAHRHLVVHRDIKSSNVLVRSNGEAKLLDFGIAKLMGQYNGATLTRLELGPMTPEYAAPEQFRGGTITVATDIYQFGVLCYKVLTDRLPFTADSEDYYGWARAALEKEPVSLRKAVERGHTGVDPQYEYPKRQFKRQLTPDLDAVIRKMLAKEPDDRYPSVDALISDVEGLLAGRTVSARHASRWYSTRRFLTRHRTAVSFGALALITIIGTAAVAIWEAIEARSAAAIAQTESQNAEQVSQFLTKLFTVSDPGENRGARLTANDILEVGAKRLETELADNPLQRGRLASTIGKVYMNMGEYRRSAAVLDQAIAWLNLGGADIVETTRALDRRAFVLAWFGEFDEALAKLTEAENLLARRHDNSAARERALIRGTRAGVLTSLDRVADGIAEYRAGLAEIAVLEGDKSLSVGWFYSNLGNALSQDGRYDEALAAFRRAEAIYRSMYGTDHAQTIVAVSDVARGLANVGEYDEAISLAVHVVEVAANVYGGKGRQLGTSLSTLGLVEMKAHHFGASVDAYEKALRVLAEAEYGLTDEYASVLADYASCLLLMDALQRARETAQEALTIRIQVLGRTHGSTRESYAQLAQMLSALGKNGEALENAQLAAGDLERLDPVRQAYVLRALALAEAANGLTEAAGVHATRGLKAVDERPMLSIADPSLTKDLRRLAVSPGAIAQPVN